MKKKFILSFGSALILIVSSTICSAETNSAQWSYHGDSGPEHWGNLSKDYFACNKGKNQSPIHIKKRLNAKLNNIEFDYNMLIGDEIVNTGHSVKVKMNSGGKLIIDGKEYALKQFHFHSPSEHMINDASFPAEVHFVHQAEDGELAVFGMVYGPGRPDPLLDMLWKKMPMKKGDANRLDSKDLQTLESSTKMKQYYRYNGSLTTPPCSEGVIWIVSKSKLSISRKQLDKLQDALKHPNNRPVQPVNARVVVK